MSQTLQETVIAAAGEVIAFGQRFASLRADVDAYLARNDVQNYPTSWASLATAALNADGTIGTDDPTPDVTHPITVGNIFRSSNDLAAMVAMLRQYQNFMTNLAVQTDNRQVTAGRMTL